MLERLTSSQLESLASFEGVSGNIPNNKLSEATENSPAKESKYGSSPTPRPDDVRAKILTELDDYGGETDPQIRAEMDRIFELMRLYPDEKKRIKLPVRVEAKRLEDVLKKMYSGAAKTEAELEEFHEECQAAEVELNKLLGGEFRAKKYGEIFKSNLERELDPKGAKAPYVSYPSKTAKVADWVRYRFSHLARKLKNRAT